MMISVTFRYILIVHEGIKGRVFFVSFTYAQVSSLNETEAQVYNYVMMNRDKVMDESIRELAHDTHVSTATVIRFCKKMGCSGFLELKYKLKDHIHTQSSKAKLDTGFMSFVAYTNTKKYQDSIQRAADIIQNADTFFVLGLRHCADFAKYVARTFSHIGYYCYGFVDNLYPAQDVPEGETSVIMIVYDKALENLIFEEIRKYKSKNYQVILISSEDVGAMEHLCDDVIYVSDGKVRHGMLTSGVPMLYAVERIVGILTKDEIEEE